MSSSIDQQFVDQQFALDNPPSIPYTHTVNWFEDPNSVSLDDASMILRDDASRKLFPRQFLLLQRRVESLVERLTDQAKLDDPLSFAKFSFEQIKKLNAWWCGITNIINFSSNRIGKTSCQIFNALLYLLPIPSASDFKPLQPYIDHKGRLCQLLRRPSIETILKIQKALKSPEFVEQQLPAPNPDLPHYHEDNAGAYSFLLQSGLLTPNAPNVPSIIPPAHQSNPNVIWHGAPDNDAHKEVTIPEWKKWLPKRYITRISDYEGQIDLEIPRPCKEGENLPPIKWQLITKSYDSKDTKWAGAAVDGIILSEGPPKSIFYEVRQRFKVTGFGGWDFTPYEPRNQGHKSNLAHKVFRNEEQAPLNPFIFSKESALDAPDFILPQEKKDDLKRMWEGNPQGKARLYGEFYTSIPQAFPNLSVDVHCLHITFDDLRRIRPNLLLYRAIDPGWSHVTAAVWAALSPANEWFVYQGYAEAQRTIEQRVCDIIALSGNQRILHSRDNNQNNLYLEQQINQQYVASFIDWHTFKADEITGAAFAYNYIRAGLRVSQSIRLGPKERVAVMDDKSIPRPHLPHPISPSKPGAKIYFLLGTPTSPTIGVANIWDKCTNYFWKSLEGGPRRGQVTDDLQDTEDDEVDALTYLVSSPIRYSQHASQIQHKQLLTNKSEKEPKQMMSLQPI